MQIILLLLLTPPFLFVGLQTGSPAEKPKSSPPQLSTHNSMADDASEVVRQSALDATGYDSSLWRSEYLPGVNDRQQETTASTGAAVAISGDQDSIRRASEKAPDIDATLARLINSERVGFEVMSVPIGMASSELTPDANADEMSMDTMSDWEYASSVATQGKPGFMANGPSATSAIVGFMGILIVVGAYVSSLKPVAG